MESTQNKTRCPHSKKCGGCQLQNLDYKEQLAHKERTCIRLLGKFCRVEPIIGMENPYHYRNKVQAAFGTTRAGRIISGIYQSSTHNIVAVDSCMTEDEIADRIIVDIRRLLRDFKMTTYNEVTGRGFLRHVLVKRGFQTGEVMVVLVTGTPIFPARNNFTRALLKLHPEITTIIQNVNDRYTSMLLGQNEKTLYGPGYITDILCGLRFRISAKSFYQINPVQTEVLYGKAMEFAELTGKETVIDAYCGIGTIGMVAAKKAGQVLGVEVNRDAVRDARENAKLNRVKNIRFVCADAGDFMVDMANAGEHCDVLFMDPPRAGSDTAFLSCALTLAPRRIVYVSCNPETLARDLNFLTKRGYRAEKIQPVDMFPHTDHVETVALLTREKSVKSYAYVNISPSELGMGGKVKKPTYKQIKEYVQKTHGLKVSSLYIANLKDELGLDKQFSYEEAEMSAEKRPKCPPEKREAILDAFRHFGMMEAYARPEGACGSVRAMPEHNTCRCGPVITDGYPHPATRERRY